MVLALALEGKWCGKGGCGLTEVIRHARERAGHVAFRRVRLHRVLDVAVSSHDGEPRREGVVEARGADDSVQLDDLARLELDALGYDAGDAFCDHFHIRLSQSLQVTRSRRDSATSQGEIRDEGFAELLVAAE